MAILSHSVLDVATLMIAGMRYGLAVVNLNPDISTEDARVALGACRPARLIADRAILDRIAVARTGVLGLLRRRGPGVAGLAVDLAGAVPAAPPSVPPRNATGGPPLPRVA